MQTVIRWIMILMCVDTLAGCAVSQHKYSANFAAPAPMTADADGQKKTELRADRMLIWKANLTIEVANVSKAVCEATAQAEAQGGYVEQKSDQGEESASVTLRVPANVFKAAVGSFESLGKVTFRNLTGEDVTEQYVDVDAKLKNLILLRDRLKQHLDKAVDVKDIVAIETELNRVQTELDSLQGRIKSLKGQVDYSTIVLDLKRKSIPGPLGYFFSKAWWCVEKLFVIRE